MGILRLILAISVLLWHIPGHKFIIFHAGIAVIIFFIISGFYMSLVINEKYALILEEKWITKFYLNRILRLMPIYIVFCVIEFLWYLNTNNPTVFTNTLNLKLQSHIALIFMNLFIVGQDLWQTIIEHTKQNQYPGIIVGNLVHFFGENAFNQNYILVGQAWSLATEILFYLLAPFIVRSRKRIALILVGSLLLRVFFLINVKIFPCDPWRYRFLPSTLVFFMLGNLSYQIYKFINTLSRRKNNFIGGFLIFIVTTFVLHSLIVKGGVLLSNGVENYDTAEDWFFYILITITIPFLFNLYRQSKIDTLIGQLSYPIYIIHGLIIGIVINFFKPNQTPLEQAIFIIFLTILFSFALIYGIDKPIDKHFRKLPKTKIAQVNKQLSG